MEMEPTQTQTQATQPQTPGTNQSQQIDPTALALSRAIRSVESNGNYNAVGDNGESHGAYQFNKSNFQDWAKEYGLDPNDTSETNQDHVAYLRIKGLLDKGIPPSQVAAIWNGATYSNGQYQAINPGYVDKVKNAYNQQLSGGSQNTSQSGYLAPGVPSLQLNSQSQNTSSQDQEPSLGKELEGRTSAFGAAIQNALAGKINPVSGVLQSAGAVAGGIGDVMNKGLELIPGVKQLEGLIGHGVGALAQTPAGQSVAQSIQSFSQAHPELSADIGAGFNIATAIPIFDGLSALKSVATDGISSVLQNVAKKSVVDGTEQAMNTGRILSRSFIKNGGRDVVKNAVDALGKDAVPSIEGGKYSTETAFHNVGDAISKIEDEQLQPLLKKASTNKIADRFPLEQARQDALGDAISELKSTDPIDAYFDRIKAKYGDYPSLEQLNEAKRTVAQNISESGFNSPSYSTDKIVRSALQKAVEDGANGLGLGDVATINKRMGNLIKYQNMLASLDKTPVKMGLVRRTLQRAVAGGAGATIGGMVGGGIPGEVVGGIVGERASGLMGPRNVGGIMGGLLKPGAASLSKNAGKRIAGLVATSALPRSRQH